MKKKLLCLGGSRLLMPIIHMAHQLGYAVVTCDYLPNNYAHKYSDVYENVSVVNKEAVLEIARKHQISGICSFGCDAGVVSAAHVAEQMNLPSVGPYESICILQDKVKFRKFLQDNNFNVPISKGYFSVTEAIADADSFYFPIIVKPADSAGSKGVTKVENIQNLSAAVELALKNSLSHRIIIEEFIEQKGFASDCDCFAIDGKMVFTSFSSQWFDDSAQNPYTPIGFSWPTEMSNTTQQMLASELQRLVKLLNMRTGIYNVESREGKDGKCYIMEMSPRGGGNRLAEMIRYVYNVDLIEYVVKSAMGESLPVMQPVHSDCFWSEVILHSNTEGLFRGIAIDSEIENNFLIEKDLWINVGEKVHSMQGGHHTIGTLVLKYPNYDTLKKCMQSVNDWLKIKVKEVVFVN